MNNMSMHDCHISVVLLAFSLCLRLDQLIVQMIEIDFVIFLQFVASQNNSLSIFWFLSDDAYCSAMKLAYSQLGMKWTVTCGAN